MAEASNSPQTPAKCQVCDEGDITCICLNCDLFLCQRCSNRIHSRSKSGQDHKVISLKDLGTEDSADMHRRADLENLTCEVHQRQRCVSFCNKCKYAICIKCLTDSHGSHKQSDLYDKYNDNLSKIREMKDTIIDKISYLKREDSNLEKIIVDCKKEFDDIKQAVLKKEQDIYEAVAKNAKTLIKEIEDICNPLEDNIRDKLNIWKNKLDTENANIDKILLSHSANDVLEGGVCSDLEAQDINIEDISQSKVRFIPVNSRDTQTLIGKLHKIPEFTMVNTYEPLEIVNNILHSGHHEKLITCPYSKKLQRVKFDNDKMTVLKEENIEVHDMAVMDNGNVIISSGVSELKIYINDGSLKTFKDFPSFETTGVHVNKYGEVLVGLTEPGSVKVTPKSIRKMVVLNHLRNIKHTYAYDRNRQRLFTVPIRIRTCHDTIFVLDMLNDEMEGRVVGLDYGNHMQWVYNGEGNKGQNKFYPTGLAVTSTDMILVADCCNHAIHVLDITGQVIVCRQVKNLGIEFPFSLDIDFDGLVWVGYLKPDDESENIGAKFWVLKVELNRWIC